ncbi:placenta-specific gene 8 protein-like [Mugil cephalus]|uniref:placenta-specific gene 8 protein-like n=1 Tax=Mugil cephalus TaxID=48193 RepID=UPI001FB73A9F|nr:placenta-specific gene 8 protein-like [Mugil cephalus]
MAVTNQPVTYEPTHFQTGLCSCWEHMNEAVKQVCEQCQTCCHDMCFLPCLGCFIARELKECCCCGLSTAIRSIYRTRYNIRGSLCKDFIATTFCAPCAACQLKRDIERRKMQGLL